MSTTATVKQPAERKPRKQPADRKPRKLITLNPTKKDSFAIGVSADNYHFITKLAAAKNTNRAQLLDEILDAYVLDLLRSK